MPSRLLTFASISTSNARASFALATSVGEYYDDDAAAAGTSVSVRGATAAEVAREGSDSGDGIEEEKEGTDGCTARWEAARDTNKRE